MADNPDLTASDAGQLAGFKSNAMGPMWVKRFNEEGLSGLEDRPRPGRKPVHSQEVRGALISLALQKPRSLGYPFELWTLSGCKQPFENDMASTYPIQPFGPGWMKKDSSGSGNRVGSMKQRNTTQSSWKKGVHNPGLCGAASANTSHLC